MTTTYDAIVVGAGQAGPGLARVIAGKGQRVAVIEGERVGGTCVNYGCTPSKTLIGSARAIYAASRGDEFGFDTGGLKVEFTRVMERQHTLVSDMRARGEQRLETMENGTFYRGWATFESPRQIRVGDELLESERIYLDVGGRAALPDLEGLDTVPYLTNKTLIDLRELPRHLIILGGGYVAMEYGQAFRRFGADVTILQRGAQVLGNEDADVADAARCILEKEGVRILLNTSARKLEKRGDSVVVHVEQNGQMHEVEGSHLLLATGRRPNTDLLGVEKAGIELDDKGYIRVDDHLKTSVDGIYALGEANGHGPFTHTAYNDYEIAADNLNGGSRKISDRITIYGVFIDPPLGRVGMTETEARKSGRNALIGTLPMSDVNRASEFGQTDGFIKILVDGDTQQFLGASILGLGGDEVVHAISVLMYAKAPYTVLKNAVHIHPTVTELLPTVLDRLEPLK